MEELDLDVLVVGAGFSGIYLLKLLRDKGFKVKLFEGGNGLGGTWNNNRYPGARVDSEIPIYSYSYPELWNEYTWPQRYPDHFELRKYFNYVDKKWELSKDVYYNTYVKEAHWQKDNYWLVKTATGLTCKCKWFLPATGTSAVGNTPKWPGYDEFKGEIHHSAEWPQDGVDVKGKRVALIGAGATAVQIMQEFAKDASAVTNFIRNPATAVPMRQRNISADEFYHYKNTYPAVFSASRESIGGEPYPRDKVVNTFDDTKAQREAFWEEQWARGGFNFVVAALYGDTLTDEKANREIYQFWAKKIRARISDPAKRELLAPLEPKYFFMTKRPPLEQDYYEMCDQPHVELTSEIIVSFEEKGIRTKERLREFDVIAVATGFDAVDGGLRQIDIRGRDGLELKAKWKEGVATHLGMAVHGFPNMMFPYGPQAPTSLTLGVPFIEQQCEWIASIVTRARDEKLAAVDSTAEAEAGWSQLCAAIANATLIPRTDSWWMGANVPGKPREMLIFAGGIPMWKDACANAVDGWKEFDTTPVS